MMDIWDWQPDGAELDATMASCVGRSYPPGVMEAYRARQRARHRAMQAEIDRLNATTANGPAVGANGAISVNSSTTTP